MGREGAVEEGAADGTRPILVDAIEGAIHCIDRKQAQAVVGKWVVT
jgi:hypothetical protein